MIDVRDGLANASLANLSHDCLPPFAVVEELARWAKALSKRQVGNPFPYQVAHLDYLQLRAHVHCSLMCCVGPAQVFAALVRTEHPPGREYG